MHLIFHRTIGSSGIDILAGDSWDEVKRKHVRCLDFDDIQLMDNHDGWRRLQEGCTLFDGALFVAYLNVSDPDSKNAFKPFDGELIEFFQGESGLTS